MGLDSVELSMEVEHEFGFEIPDHAAESITTVDEFYDYVKSQIAVLDPQMCLSRQLFYKLRRALVANYGLERALIHPGTPIDQLISREQLAAGWPFLKLFVDLDTPPFSIATGFLGWEEKFLTVGEIVDGLILVNRSKLKIERDSPEDIWVRLVDVFVRQLNINADEVRRSASIIRDLGVD